MDLNSNLRYCCWRATVVSSKKKKSEGTFQLIKVLWAEKCYGVCLTVVQGILKTWLLSTSGVICTPAFWKIIERLSLWTHMKSTGFSGVGIVSSILFFFFLKNAPLNHQKCHISVTELWMSLKTGVLLSLNQRIIWKCTDIKFKHYYANAHSYNLKIDGLLVFFNEFIYIPYYLSGQLDVICFIKHWFLLVYNLYLSAGQV